MKALIANIGRRPRRCNGRDIPSRTEHDRHGQAGQSRSSVLSSTFSSSSDAIGSMPRVEVLAKLVGRQNGLGRQIATVRGRKLLCRLFARKKSIVS